MDPWSYVDTDDDDDDDFVLWAALCAALWCYYHQVCGIPRQIQSGSANFWDGFRNVYGEILSSKKQNIMDSALQKKADDDAEYEEFMRDLIYAGVDPDSPEYIMASVVLLDVSCRGAYRPIPSIDKKLRWIKRMYLIMKGGPPPVP